MSTGPDGQGSARHNGPEDQPHTHSGGSVNSGERTDELHGGGPCAICGRDPAVGFAQINDDWYCHGDDDSAPSCYERSWQTRIAKSGVFLNVEEPS